MNTRKTIGSLTLALSGTGLLACAMLLLQGQVQSLKHIREDALPLAATLPPLERRVQLLRKQVELAEVQATIRGQSANEKLRTFVLPKDPATPRLLAFVESIQTFMQRRKMMRSMSAVTIGEPGEEILTPGAGEKPETLWKQKVHLSATVSAEGHKELLSLLELSGLLTVADALSPKDIDALFRLTEEQNYAGIVPIEQFLSADLEDYVADPTMYDARLTQALTSDEFIKAFRSLLGTSNLSRVKSTLEGDLGRTILARKLWPAQFLSINRETVEDLGDGWMKVDLSMEAYGRK